MNLILTTLEQGLIYALLGTGVYVTFKLLNIADLTVEGTFPMGALITAGLISAGVNPILATIIACLAGMIPGLITGLLTIKLKIDSLLAGILTMTMLYSVNLKINGRSNVPISDAKSVFNMLSTGNAYVDRLIILAIIVLIGKFALDLFMMTKKGYMLIVTGDNKSLVKSLGQNPDKYMLIGLMISNAYVALSGSLLAQSMKFADIQMGTGIIVIALASVIIGLTSFRNTDLNGSTRAIIGAIIYKIIGTLAIQAGLNPNDLKLINGLIVIVFIAYNNFYTKRRTKNASHKKLI
ncbi:MAG: ABC transporter permease [Tissierellia bacterium]|nr:ABC transporter permease [Tissierellia bacterium]